MENLATTFAALGDSTRLAIVEQLLDEGECTVGEIAARHPVSMPAVSRHLKVLERAGILERRVERQWRVCHLQPEALARVEDWIERHRAFWNSAFDRLERLMREDKAKDETKNRPEDKS